MVDLIETAVAEKSIADDTLTSVRNAFETIRDPFTSLNSAYMQEKYFRENFHLVRNVKTPIGVTHVHALNDDRCQLAWLKIALGR